MLRKRWAEPAGREPSLARGGRSGRRPAPVFDLGHVLAVFADVGGVLGQFVAHRLLA